MQSALIRAIEQLWHRRKTAAARGQTTQARGQTADTRPPPTGVRPASTPPGRSEAGPASAELEGCPLRYLIGTDTYGSGRDGEIIEVSYDASAKPAKGLAVKYCNLLDEKSTGAYGPYLHASDTAAAYHEGRIDPKGPGWSRNLSEQFARAAAQGFRYVELDNGDAYCVADVAGAASMAARFGLRVLAKNPLLVPGDPKACVADPNVAGVIVERGAGSAAEMDALRRNAGRPHLPVWFVAFGDGRAWAGNVATEAKDFPNMGVTYAGVGEYGSATDLLVPRKSDDGRQTADDKASNSDPSPVVRRPSSNFATCFNHVLIHEGGNDNDPRDPGGRTSRGITQKEWTAWRQSHPGLPSDVWKAPRDEVEAIYKQKYWDVLACDALPRGVDYAVFDYGVNSGVARAAHALQECVMLPADAIVGTATIAAVARCDPRALIAQICDQRIAFLRELRTFETFGRGWSRRVADVRLDATAMVRSPEQARGAPSAAPAAGTRRDSPADLAARIAAAMQARGYEIAVGEDVMNIVYIEGMDPDGTPNTHVPNHWDDLRLLLRVRPDASASILGKWEATTRAGKFFEQTAPMNPAGAFHIALGQQRAWVLGTYHEQEALIEAAPLCGTRDGARDYARSGAAVRGTFGVHHHWGYNYPHDDLGRSSAGCQVGRTEEGHRQFIWLLKTDARWRADRSFMWSSTVMPAQWVAPPLQS